MKRSACCIVVTLRAPGLTFIVLAQACIVTLLKIFVVINNHKFVPPSPNAFSDENFGQDHVTVTGVCADFIFTRSKFLCVHTDVYTADSMNCGHNRTT